ncbi:MAG: TSUP family transporter, partial [Acetobacteraceae bacterium]
MMQAALALGSGGLVGFVLGLIGGGGSIVATPLLLYAVGLPPHAALGTGALAVSANAFINFAGHARAGNVRWAVAAIFSAAGAIGAFAGS